MDPRREALLRFSRRPLKHAGCQWLLQEIAANDELLQRLVFVHNREFLPNTLLISEAGSAGVPFELELGVTQREEVSIVNGRLVRHTHRTRSRCVTDPMEAAQALQNFKGRLYVVFVFQSETPSWYEAVVEPNPALPPDEPGTDGLAGGGVDDLRGDVVRHQIELVLLAIVLREEIDQALARRDAESFYARAPLYREVMQRCLWEL